MKVLAARHTIRNLLSEIAGEWAEAEAEQILLYSLHQSRSFLFAHPEFEIPEMQKNLAMELATRRCNGEPLQYILGSAPFMGFEFAVRPGVLIPRPDTEILVETAIPYCEKADVLDLCTGSGCIAVSVALLGKAHRVCAADLSEDALAIAAENASVLGAQVTFYRGDFLEAIPEGIMFDVILSNPPYISRKELETLPADVRRFEPPLALDGGEDGLSAYRKILQKVACCLRKGGRLFLEIGYRQGAAVCSLMDTAGFAQICVRKDYGGQDRVVSGILIE